MKKIIAAFAAIVLSVLGLVVGATPAEAHTGDLEATAVCQTNGTYLVTYTLKLSSVPSGNTGTIYWRVGTNSFDGTPTNSNGMTLWGTKAGNGTVTLGTKTLPGNSTQAPWAYAWTKWSDNFSKGSDGGDIKLAGTCNSPKPDDKKVTQLIQGNCDTVYQSKTRDGIQEYVLDPKTNTWVLEDESKIAWGDWKVTNWTDDAWFKACAPDKPKDIVVPFSDKKQDCTGVYETSWKMVTGHVWNPVTRKWDATAPTKQDFVDWHRTGDVSNEYFDMNCKPDKPEPKVTRVPQRFETCTPKPGYVETWDIVTTINPVWDSEKRQWVDGTTVVAEENYVKTPYTQAEYLAKCVKPVKVTKYFQVDTYSNPTQKLANKAAAYDNDGKLKWGEDKAHYGHSHYQTIKVKGLNTWTNAQWRTAINKATTKHGVKSVNSSSHTKSLKKGQKLTVAWLIHGDWKHHPQTFFAKGIS